MTLQQLLARQQEIVNTCKSAAREMTPEEQREFAELQEQINAARAAGSAGGSGTITEEQRQAVIAAERARVSEITAMCRELGIGEERSAKFVSGGQTVDQVRAAIIEEMRQSHSPIPQGNREHDVDVIADERDKYVRAAADGVLLKGNVSVSEAAEGSGEFRGMSLKDLAVECLERDGEKNVRRKSADEVYSMIQRSAYNPTSTFTAIMDSTVQKAVAEGYKMAGTTFARFTRKGTLTDFKKHDANYLFGPAGEFLEVPENGELKADTYADKKRPERQLKTYGRQFTMTRQAFVNDDLDFITSRPAAYAASAAKTINKQVYSILVNNPKFADNKAIFHADHKNLISSGTAVTAAAIQKMMTALSAQTDDFGEAIMIRPAHIVVPVGYAMDIYSIFKSPTINTSGNTQAANPLYEKSDIDIVEDPTLNALCGGFGNTMPWFLVGDQTDVNFIEVDYLNGQETPTIRRSEVPGTLGFVWDVFLDWGITCMDFRGAVKNPGTTVASPL